MMKKKRGAIRFQKKIFLLVFGLLVIFFLILNLVYLFSSIKEYERNQSLLMKEILLKVQERVRSYLSEEIGKINILTQNSFGYSDLSQQKIILESYLKDEENLFFISLTDSQGKEILKVSRKEFFGQKDLKDLALTKEFYQAKRGEIFISDVEFSQEGTPFLRIAIPSIVFKDKGMLVTELSLRKIWEIIGEIKIGKEGKIYLTDKNGRLIADPDPSLVYREMNLINLLPVKNVLSGKEVLALTKENIYLRENGKKVLAFGIFLPKFNWALMAEVPWEEIYYPIFQKILFSISLLFLAIIFSFISSRKISLYLASPIEEFKRGIEIIRKGNLSHQIKLETGDEIEELARAFNQMTKDLEESRANLEESKAVLEIKVAARTRELREIAERQEEIIKERTKELEEKIEELEKFHKLAVGRELKMIELKEELKKLREEMKKG
jgi:HAMP domain-containing protein